MTIEDQITALLAEAAPLRLLPDEEAEAKGLPGIVERINALRAMQAGGPKVVAPEVDVDPFAPIIKTTPALPARRPGRQRKTPVEGADA